MLRPRSASLTIAQLSQRVASRGFSLLAMIALLVLVFYPLASILIQSIMPDLFGVPARVSLTMGAFGRAFASPEIYSAMANTLWLGVAVAVLASALGALLAVLFQRTDLPGRRLFNRLVWVNLFTPSYLVALAWELIYSRGGWIDSLITPLPDGVINLIFSPVGLVLFMSLRMFPFAYLAVGAALNGLGSEYDDAARMVGARPVRRWVRVNLPLLAPALFAGGLIIFAETISDYGTAATIAQQAGFNLVTYELYAAMNNAPVDFALSASLAVMLVGAIAGALIVQSRVVRLKSYQIVTGRSRRARPLLLGRWRVPLAVISALFFVVVLLLPLLATTMMSFMRNIGNGLAAGNLSWTNYQQVFDTSSNILPSLQRSVLLALATATIAALLGAATAYVVERTHVPGRAFLRLLTLVTLAIPGIVLAVGYIFAWNQPWMNNLPSGTPYGTLGLLLAAYIAGALPFSARLATGALAQVGDHLIEASRIAGANTIQIFARIILPVIATATLSTWMLIFTGTIFELPASELLQPPGQPPLAIQIVAFFSTFRLGPGTAMTVAGLAAIIATALIISLVARVFGLQGGRRASSSL